MKQDKFLFAIVITIVVLMVLAVGVFLVRQSSQTYIAEDTPEGVVHNYVFAIQQEDYQRAYGYLAEGKGKPSFLDFHSFYKSNILDSFGIQIKSSEEFEEDNGDLVAYVNLVIIESNNEPLFNDYRNNSPVNMIFQDGEWRIIEFAFRLWPWEWYQKEVSVP